MSDYLSTASMSSAILRPGETVFKITLERRKESEMRRVRGTFTFGEMVSVVRHMWNSAPKSLLIEYDDEEGDRVRVSTELEWSEAIQQHTERGAPSLKLFVRRATRSGGKSKGAEEVSASDTEDPRQIPDDVVVVEPVRPRREASRTVTAPAPAGAAVKPLASAGTNAPASQPTVVTPAVPAVVIPPPPAPVASTPSIPRLPVEKAKAPAMAQGADHGATIDLLSRLYDCDAAAEMLDMFSRVDFTPVVSRRVDAVAQEVHVDVDNAALRHLTVSRTNLWIGGGLYEKAEATLAAALRVWPEDAVLEYNYACSASLRGDVSKAVELLKSAVEHGYRNAQQLRTDPDLAHARDHPEFMTIFKKCKGEPEPQPAAPPAPAVVPAAVAAPVRATVMPTPAAAPATTSLHPDAQQLMAIFPSLTAEGATGLLRAHNGDLQRATLALLQ